VSAPLDARRADRTEITARVRAAGTSFYRGMQMLPPDRRLAMYAVYGFCREVDDIADQPGPEAEKQARLAAWRSRVAALYRGEADGAIARVLLPAIRRFGLREADFLAVIDGMAMDAGAPIVAPDLATLDLYCDRVAGAVGRLSVRAFGDASAAADRVAEALGRALQLTNILRDLAEDARDGRLYLPREWLDEAGVPRDPAGALACARIGLVCARVAALAHRHFDAAAAAMADCDRRAMRPARLMAATYAALLRRIERRGWNRPAERISLPAWQKLWIALRHSGALG
jgi:squalene synthase HpnD